MAFRIGSNFRYNPKLGKALKKGKELPIPALTVLQIQYSSSKISTDLEKECTSITYPTSM